MAQESPRRTRYRFGAHTVSPARRELRRDGQLVPLIPRYFDLLVLLLEHRERVVSRREILDTVWSDVVVSDGALTQAVRTIRRALDGEGGESRIRTVPRVGYQFAGSARAEADDDVPPPSAAHSETPRRATPELLEDLLGSDAREARAAAEALLAGGAGEVFEALATHPDAARAFALLRDARWDVPGAHEVPLGARTPGARLATILALVRLRLRRGRRLVGARWASAAGGGALAGALAGLTGGLALLHGPGSAADASVLVALPLFGALVGGAGAAGVGAGLAGAEAVFRLWRGLMLAVCGALGGGLVGALAHLLGLVLFRGFFGGDLSPAAGGFEGLVIGGAAGIGYALATPRPEGGMASPQGVARARAALVTGLICALAGVGLALTGSYLGAMSLDLMARAFPDSQVALDPLARLLGEARPGTLTVAAVSAFEGLCFGAGVAFGLTRRPRKR